MNLSEKLICFHQRHRAISHILFWILLLLVQISSSSYFNSDQVPFRNNLMGDCTNLFTQILAAYFLAYYIVPHFFLRQKYLEALVYFIVGSYFICVISRITVIYIEEPFYGRKHNPKETIVEIVTDISKLVFVYFFRIFSVAFIFMFLKLLKDQLTIQKHALFLEKEKAETELKMLKAQLNPHFLFNTLNNIYSLSLDNSPATAGSIARLSEILDYILYKCNQVYVPVSEEIKLLQNYIELEKLRYGNRLQVNFKITVDAHVPIAPLLLLSVVENAFKHGASEQTENSIIEIELYSSHTGIYFKVTNPCNYISDNDGKEKIGLRNLKRQLELIYSDRYILDIVQNETIFSVSLQLNATSK
jgi:hypothetical protein